jgi:hypothetical protein
MKNSAAKTILLVVEGILGVAGMILLLVSMFGNAATNLPLTLALGCVGLAGVINVIFLVMRGKEKKD